MTARSTTNSCGTITLAETEEGRFVLMVRHHRGWSFPKGHMEPGESEQETAVRETFEETGIHVRIIPGPSFSVPSAREDERRQVIFFPAESADGLQTPSSQEVLDAAWVPAAEALNRIAYEADRRVLCEMLEYRNSQGEKRTVC